VKRFQILDGRQLTGEGCQWTDGSFDLRLDSHDGGASHCGDNMAEAERWLREMSGFRDGALAIVWVDKRHNKRKVAK